jgi:hypothetical protein
MDLQQFADGTIPEGFDIDEQNILGSDATFRDRLLTRFKVTDVVRVINPTEKSFSWDFMPEENEIAVMNGDRTGYITYRKKPEHYTLAAGEEMPITGSNACLMVEALAKHMILDKSIVEGSKSNQMNQPAIQEEYIDKIVVNVENLLSMSNKLNKKEVVPTEDSLEADLGLIEEEIPRRRTRATA